MVTIDSSHVSPQQPSRTDGDDVPRRRRVIPAPPDDVPSDADVPKLVRRDDAEHIQVRLK